MSRLGEVDIPDDLPDQLTDTSTRVVILAKLILMDAIFKKRQIDSHDLPLNEKGRIKDRLNIGSSQLPDFIKALHLYEQFIEAYQQDQVMPEGETKYQGQLAKQLWFMWYHIQNDIPLDSKCKRGILTRAKEYLGWTDDWMAQQRRLLLELYNYVRDMERIDY